MAYEQFANRLADIVGKANVLASEEDRKVYSYDGTSTWTHKPDLVVFPTETEHVEAVLKLANENRIPVTPRGGGTNVSGGSVPIRGGIVLVMTKMNKILSVDAANLSARVQAGVVLMDLQTALAKERLFFPPDPQSFLGATLGGIIAENAGGPVCLKYGVTKQYVLGLKAVLPTGRIVEFGGSTVKNVVGYDLVSLVTGSEGTLAVVTEAVLRLLPLPPARKTIIALFDDLPKSGETVGKILDAGTIPAKIELLDNWVVRSINRITGMGLPEDAAAMLMFECDGTEDVVEHDSRNVIRVCEEVGATQVLVADDPAKAQAYWKARSAGFAAVFGAAPTVLAEDVTVPRTRMAEFIQRVTAICKKADLEVTVIGHAGDGNLHPSVMTDAKDPAHFQKAQRAVDEIIEAAVEFGGVLSGEHGIGLEKQKFMRRTQDPIFIDLMRNIKDIFDPNGILNPGKIWEDRSG
ncbi:MAG: FAD-binding protein [Planctomycetaceae bacterium]|nr:FAD-binding protein [Planctomycetaceae bacterium]